MMEQPTALTLVSTMRSLCAHEPSHHDGLCGGTQHYQGRNPNLVNIRQICTGDYTQFMPLEVFPAQYQQPVGVSGTYKLQNAPVAHHQALSNAKGITMGAYISAPNPLLDQEIASVLPREYSSCSPRYVNGALCPETQQVLAQERLPSCNGGPQGPLLTYNQVFTVGSELMITEGGARGPSERGFAVGQQWASPSATALHSESHTASGGGKDVNIIAEILELEAGTSFPAQASAPTKSRKRKRRPQKKRPVSARVEMKTESVDGEEATSRSSRSEQQRSRCPARTVASSTTDTSSTTIACSGALNASSEANASSSTNAVYQASIRTRPLSTSDLVNASRPTSDHGTPEDPGAPGKPPPPPPSKRGKKSQPRGTFSLTPSHTPGSLTPKGHSRESSPGRLRSATGGAEVMAKMYFHRKKEAWRAELLIDGTKRQKSFSCKLYGYERAKMMCGWARNFVLETNRLPTDEEACTSLQSLLEVPLPEDKLRRELAQLEREFRAASCGVRLLPHDFSAGGSMYPSTDPGFLQHSDAQGVLLQPELEHQERAFEDSQSFPLQHEQCLPAGEQIAQIEITDFTLPLMNQEPLTQAPLQAAQPCDLSTQTVVVPASMELPTGERLLCFSPGKAMRPPQEVSLAKSVGPTYVVDLMACRRSNTLLPGSLKEEEDALLCEFPELTRLRKLKVPKSSKAKKFRVGKKPYSGVRGIYFQQGQWKVNYRGDHEAATKLFPYPPGEFKEMRKQFVLARIFLRQVIDKNRHVHDSDGDGLSDYEPEWIKRGAAGVTTTCKTEQTSPPKTSNHSQRVGSPPTRSLSPPQTQPTQPQTPAETQPLCTSKAEESPQEDGGFPTSASRSIRTEVGKCLSFVEGPVQEGPDPRCMDNEVECVGCAAFVQEVPRPAEATTKKYDEDCFRPFKGLQEELDDIEPEPETFRAAFLACYQPRGNANTTTSATCAVQHHQGLSVPASMSVEQKWKQQRMLLDMEMESKAAASFSRRVRSVEEADVEVSLQRLRKSAYQIGVPHLHRYTTASDKQQNILLPETLSCSVSPPPNSSNIFSLDGSLYKDRRSPGNGHTTRRHDDGELTMPNDQQLHLGSVRGRISNAAGSGQGTAARQGTQKQVHEMGISTQSNCGSPGLSRHRLSDARHLVGSGAVPALHHHGLGHVNSLLSLWGGSDQDLGATVPPQRAHAISYSVPTLLRRGETSSDLEEIERFICCLDADAAAHNAAFQPYSFGKETTIEESLNSPRLSDCVQHPLTPQKQEQVQDVAMSCTGFPLMLGTQQFHSYSGMQASNFPEFGELKGKKHFLIPLYSEASTIQSPADGVSVDHNSLKHHLHVSTGPLAGSDVDLGLMEPPVDLASLGADSSRTMGYMKSKAHVLLMGQA